MVGRQSDQRNRLRIVEHGPAGEVVGMAASMVVLPGILRLAKSLAQVSPACPRCRPVWPWQAEYYSERAHWPGQCPTCAR